jgi:hypothetical protein
MILLPLQTLRNWNPFLWIMEGDDSEAVDEGLRQLVISKADRTSIRYPYPIGPIHVLTLSIPFLYTLVEPYVVQLSRY